jgi:hypothetical protein
VTDVHAANLGNFMLVTAAEQFYYLGAKGVVIGQ